MSVGLYIHVPFCAQLCHYCDFAKTADLSASKVSAYFAALERHTGAWLAAAERSGLGPVSTLFLGGGTPGLFTHEYAPLLALIRPHLAPGAELSLEANPDNLTPEALESWRTLGFNRLSVGIQTFAPSGLDFLTRTHSPDASCQSLKAALQVFPNLNIDLIYGWQGQTLASWHEDLRLSITLGIPHLSLYSLTYEPRTPIGRRERRGLLQAMTEDAQTDLYLAAVETLAAAGFHQEEVSNWAKPGYSCAHNWRYWRSQPYLAIGAGAAGFVPGPQPWGQRYQYPANPWAFSALPTPLADDVESAIHSAGVVIEARTADDWLLEYIGAGLRTSAGISLEEAERMSGKYFQARPIVREGISRGLLMQNQASRLSLAPLEWFRENAWSAEVAMSFVSQPKLL